MNRPPRAPTEQPETPDTGQGRVYVMGAGRFGLLAHARLGERVAKLVDHDRSKLLSVKGAGCLHRDGVSATSEIMQSADSRDWLVPCVPFHLLFAWLMQDLQEDGVRPAPVADEWLPPGVASWRGREGQVLLSLAETLCPDNCPEPDEICPNTGKPRGEPLFERLRLACRQSALPVGCGVLRSHQLAPGVGGLSIGEMAALRGAMGKGSGAWVVATSCRCHGVVNALEL